MTLKLNTYVKNVNVINNSIEKFALNFIMWSFLVLSLLYVLFLGNMVSNIVERRSLEKEALALSAEVGGMELTYLSMWNNVDFNLSHSLGFEEAKAVFTTRKSIGFRLQETQPVSMIKNDL